MINSESNVELKSDASKKQEAVRHQSSLTEKLTNNLIIEVSDVKNREGPIEIEPNQGSHSDTKIENRIETPAPDERDGSEYTYVSVSNMSETNYQLNVMPTVQAVKPPITLSLDQ